MKYKNIALMTIITMSQITTPSALQRTTFFSQKEINEMAKPKQLMDRSPGQEQQIFHDNFFQPWADSLSFSDRYGKHAAAIRSYEQAHNEFQWNLENDPTNHEQHMKDLNTLWERRSDIEQRMNKDRQERRSSDQERMFDLYR